LLLFVILLTHFYIHRLLKQKFIGLVWVSAELSKDRYPPNTHDGCEGIPVPLHVVTVTIAAIRLLSVVRLENKSHSSAPLGDLIITIFHLINIFEGAHLYWPPHNCVLNPGPKLLDKGFLGKLNELFPV
jgi:hypothetical protein